MKYSVGGSIHYFSWSKSRFLLFHSHFGWAICLVFPSCRPGCLLGDPGLNWAQSSLSFSGQLLQCSHHQLNTRVQTKPGLCWIKLAAIMMLLFRSSTWSSKESFSYQLFEKLEPSVGHGEPYLCMLCIAVIWTGSPIGKTLLLFKELLAVIALPSTEVSAAFWLPGCSVLHWFTVLT